jgi:hypothetical protein
VIGDGGFAPEVDRDHVFGLVLFERMQGEIPRLVRFSVVRRLRRRRAACAPIESFDQNVLLSLRSQALCPRRQTG